jgi:hypothetical protein
MNGNKVLYGICNAAFYPSRPEGTETWYADRAHRNAALDALRTRAVGAGLAASAARAGIYAITARAATVRREHGAAPLHVRVVDDLADVI